MGLGGWRLAATWRTEGQDAAMLANRPWIDRMPEGPRDIVGHVTFLEHPRGKLGAAGRSSQWRHAIELFGWRQKGGRVDLFFPQERARGQLAAKTWRCAGEAPEPFDLCLELRDDVHRLRLYSREDWRIEPHAGTLDASPELGGVGESAVASLLRSTLAVTSAALPDPATSELHEGAASPLPAGATLERLSR